MKKVFLAIALLATTATGAFAQRFCYVDANKILERFIFCLKITGSRNAEKRDTEEKQLKAIETLDAFIAP